MVILDKLKGHDLFHYINHLHRDKVPIKDYLVKLFHPKG